MRRYAPLVLLWLVMAWIQGSCSAGRTTVSEGVFQKRRLQPGWHVDLHTTRAAKPGDRKVRMTRTEGGHGIVRDHGQKKAPASDQPMVTAAVTASNVPSGDLAPRRIAFSPVIPDHPTHPPFIPDVQEPERTLPDGPFDPLGLVALSLVVLGAAAAFLTNSGVLVSLLVVAGIVVAAIALRRIRSLERRGKGYALVALILGLLAALITAMVIIRSGF